MRRSNDPPPLALLDRGDPALTGPDIDPPHIIAGRAWIAIRRLFRTHAQLARMEGDHLALLLRTRWYGRYGFDSFGDFVREELQLSSGTARRRVSLSRSCNESPELAAALDSGRLTPSQILSLSRIRHAPDLASWIAIAEDCTVRDLDALVSAYLAELAGDFLLDASDADAGDASADVEGRRVTFAAPFSAAIAWEHGMEMARRVLGWEAPAYRCIEAVLAETAAELDRASCAEELVDVPDADEPSSSNVPGDDDPFSSKVPGENDASRETDDEPPTEERRSPAPGPSLLRVTREQLETLERTIQDAEMEIDRLISVEQPVSEDPDHSLVALKELRGKDRSLRLLFARLLRDAEDAKVFEFFGHARVTEFLTSRLKVSERTAARLMSEGWAFEGHPDLAEAFASGRIGLGQAYLVNRVAVMRTEAAFIRRAEKVTHLQFEREVRFLERLADYTPSLTGQFSGPFPLPELSTALVGCLRELGWKDWRILEHIMVQADGDPAVDPTLMDRLEGLLDLVALAMEEYDNALVASVPTLSTAVGADQPMPTKDPPTLSPAVGAGQPVPTKDPPTLSTSQVNEASTAALLAGDSRALPMLNTSTGTPHLRERTTISFWAPDWLITEWNAALDRVKAQHGPMPAWAAAIFLVRRAVKEWERVDPSRRPGEWKIFERDGWRCQAPGCSSRRRLEAHHIIFRSQNGSDDPENLITLCHGHHRRGIHEGYVRVEGTAPGKLRWRLGGGKQRADGTPRPVRIYNGNYRILNSFWT